jgi:hypothetical protein
MRRSIPAGLFILALVFPRPSQVQVRSALSSNPHRLAGIVVDERGRPVGEASLDHTGDQEAHLTDANGRFELDTRAPAVVVRKNGFRSERVNSKRRGDVAIVLHSGTPVMLPGCPSGAQLFGMEGWDARFHFPASPSFVASKQGSDVDYGIRGYALKHAGKHAPVITHGSGPTWSFGQPLDDYVWKSVSYSESDYSLKGMLIIDARGKFANGKFWRSLSRFGESVSYADADEAIAQQFNSFMDAACVNSSK